MLGYLREAPREKREIVADLDVPRSTLGRATRELEAAGLVAYDDGAYALTSVGERLLGEYDAFRRRTDVAVALEPFLRWVPGDELDVDLRHLADADLWTPEPNDPWAMVNRHVRALETAGHVRGVLPLVGLHAFETVHERITGDDLTVRFVVEPGVAETMRTDGSYAPLFRTVQEVDPDAFSVYEGELPFFLGVFDDELVQVGVDEEKEPRALLETDRDEVREWADARIATYERQATPIDADGEASNG